MLQADREYICKLQKIRTIRKRMHTKYENAIFRINNKNRSIILNGWNLCALCFTERRWKRCKQQTDRKNIVQKEINAVSLNLNARKRWKWRKTTLEKHLVHFYWCLSDCSFSLPLDGIYDAHWACCDVHLIRWGMCERVYSLAHYSENGEETKTSK